MEMIVSQFILHIHTFFDNKNTKNIKEPTYLPMID